ncbi:ACT domain-containing protein [Hahella sp. SMD15-11]|uniref:ACT domain-containing protein n=1 Tax=Thermohahella caldifontis TaxID=3142973 RepID=A0AB39UT63_9GAMM
MNHTLSLTLSDQPGALERVLRVIRVRGFTPSQVRFARVDGHWRGVLVVSGERALHTLKAQLDKLEDVLRVDDVAAPQSATVVRVAC